MSPKPLISNFTISYCERQQHDVKEWSELCWNKEEWMNEGSLKWSELWPGAVEAWYQKPTLTRSELRWLNAAFACLSHVSFRSALSRRRGEKRRRRDAEEEDESHTLVTEGCRHVTLQQAPYQHLEVLECHHCVSITSQTFPFVTSYRWTRVHKNVNTRRQVSLFHQSLWLYLLQWRLSHPRLPFPGASVEGEGRECFLFLPWGGLQTPPDYCSQVSGGLCVTQLFSSITQRAATKQENLLCPEI